MANWVSVLWGVRVSRSILDDYFIEMPMFPVLGVIMGILCGITGILVLGHALYVAILAPLLGFIFGELMRWAIWKKLQSSGN